MCAYNTRRYIETAVSRIIAQGYTNWELIISDDGSTDGTREWLQETLSDHPQVRLFLQERNMGYVANKNFCISQARGEYITQCDSDDYYDTHILEEQVQALNGHPQIKIVACGYHRIDNDGTIYETTGPQEDTIYPLRSERPFLFWYPSLLVYRDIYQELGPFTSFFNGMGDDQYWTTRANERYEIYCLKKPLYYYRDNPTSITKVLDNERKLIVPALLRSLLDQRRQTGTDVLEQNDQAGIGQLEQSFLKDRKFMGQQYRIWAAININNRQWKTATRLLQASFRQNPFNPLLYRTLFYYLRRKFGQH